MPSSVRPAAPTTSQSSASSAARGPSSSTLTSSFSFRSPLSRGLVSRSSAASAHAPSPLRRAVQRLSGAPAGAEETGRIPAATAPGAASPARGAARSTTATLPAQRLARLPVARSAASFATRKRLEEGGESIQASTNSLGKRRQTTEGSEGSGTTYDESEEGGEVDEFGRISPSVEVRHGRQLSQAGVRVKGELGSGAARPASIVTSTLPRIQSGIPASPSGKLSKIPRSGTLADVHAATIGSGIPRSRTNSSFGTLPARAATATNSPRTAAAAAAKARTAGGVPALGLPAKGRARSSLPGAAAATHNRRLSFGLPSNDAPTSVAQEGIAAAPRRSSVRTAEADRERSLRRASVIGLPVLSRPADEAGASSVGLARSRRSSFSDLSAGSSAAPNDGKENFPRRTTDSTGEHAKAAASSSAAPAPAVPRAAPRQSAATMPLRSRRSVLPPPNSFRVGAGAMDPPPVVDNTSRLQRKDSVKSRVAALESATGASPAAAAKAQAEANESHGSPEEAADAWEEEDSPSALEAYAHAAAAASGAAYEGPPSSHIDDASISRSTAASTTPVRVPAVALLRKARSAIPRSGSASSLATPEARARGMRRLSGLSLSGAFKAGAAGPRSSAGSTASPSAARVAMRAPAAKAGTPVRSKLPTTLSSSRIASPAKPVAAGASRLARPAPQSVTEADTTRDLDANLLASLQLMASKAGISLAAVRAMVAADAASRQPVSQGTTSPTSTPPRQALQRSTASEVGLDSLASVGQERPAEQKQGKSSLGLDLTQDQEWADAMRAEADGTPQVGASASRSAAFSHARDALAYDESLDDSRAGDADDTFEDSMLGSNSARVTSLLHAPDTPEQRAARGVRQTGRRFAPRETMALDASLADMELRSPGLMGSDLLEDLDAFQRMGLGGMSAYGESVGGGGISTQNSPMPVERALKEMESPMPKRTAPQTPQKEGMSTSSSAASIWASESAKKARAAGLKPRASQVVAPSPSAKELAALREAHAKLEAQLASLGAAHASTEATQASRIAELEEALADAEARAAAAEEQRSADEEQASERQRIDEEARYELGTRAEEAAQALQLEARRAEKLTERVEKAEKRAEALTKSRAAAEGRSRRAEADARRARIAEAEGRWREVAALSGAEGIVSARELAQLALAQCATWERTLTSQAKPTLKLP